MAKKKGKRKPVGRAWFLREQAVAAGFSENEVSAFVVAKLRTQPQPVSISALARQLGVRPSAIHYHMKRQGVKVESETVTTITEA